MSTALKDIFKQSVNVRFKDFWQTELTFQCNVDPCMTRPTPRVSWVHAQWQIKGKLGKFPLPTAEIQQHKTSSTLYVDYFFCNCVVQHYKSTPQI